MAGDPGQSRTEKPTARRRERARREGDVAYSADLTAAMGLAMIAMLVQSGGPGWAGSLSRGIESSLQGILIHEWDAKHTTMVARWVALQLMVAGGVVSLAVVSLSVLTGLLQTGWRVSMATVQFKWERLFSPEGVTRLFSLDS